MTRMPVKAGAQNRQTFGNQVLLKERDTHLRFSSFENAFLADAIVVQRHVETSGQFKCASPVVKVCGNEQKNNLIV